MITMRCRSCSKDLLRDENAWALVGGGFHCERCHNALTGKATLKPDPVNHPEHYKTGGIEVIDFLEAKLGGGFEDYCVGNILKYLTRYKHKNGLEDLKKAKWYLERVITWKDQRTPAKTE